MKKLGKFIENLITIILTSIILLSGQVGIILVGLPVLIIASSKLLNVIDQNKIKDSIFSVSKKGKITQNALASPVDLIKMLKTKDKQDLFIDQAKSMFEQLDYKDNKGKIKKYSTISHSLTYRLLANLAKDGYISNLEREPYKKKRLFFEKLLIGNNQDIKKKYQLYKISFSLTEKKYNKDNSTKENIILENKPNNKIQNNNEATKINNKSLEEQITELKELKQELLSESQELSHDDYKRKI